MMIFLRNGGDLARLDVFLRNGEDLVRLGVFLEIYA